MLTDTPGQGTPPPGADDERTPQQRAAEAAEDALLTWTAISWGHRARNVVRAIEAAGLRIAPAEDTRVAVRVEAFREAADCVDILSKRWRDAACRDSAHATEEVAKLLRGLARAEEARDA